MKLLHVTGFAALAVYLSACASTSGDVPPVTEMLRESTSQNGRACVRQNRIRGYGILKNDVVSIDAMQNYYLATVLPGCTDLQTSMGALFSGGFGEVCGRSSDKLVTQENRCVINQMFEFENRDEAFATYNAILEKRQELKDAAKTQE